MSHKRVVEKRGKSYGPYLYESYRDSDGKVKKRYLGKVVEQQKKKILFLSILVAFLLTVFLFATFSLTGRATFSVDNVFIEDGILKGFLSFTLQQSELLPADTQVVLDNNGQQHTYSLNELISNDLIDGDFFVEQKDISGSGLGYSVNAERFPLVSFVLGIYEEISSGTRSIPEKDQSFVEEVAEENESDIVEEIVEENESPLVEEIVEENTSGSTRSITGQVTLDLVEKIEGEVRANESFVYDLENGQNAEIISSSESVELSVENDQAIISTSYIGDLSEVVQINLDELNVSVEDGTLVISFVYNGVELYSGSVNLESVGESESASVEETGVGSLTRKVSYTCPNGMSGSGVSGDPCLIEDCTDLEWLYTGLNYYWKLSNDIDCSGNSPTPAGDGFSPGQYFNGSFDGNYKVIDNLYIDYGSSTDYIGLFGVARNAIIKNVGLTNAFIRGGSNVGGLVGYSDNNDIDSSFVTGSVYAYSGSAGGLVGYFGGSGNMDNSYAQVYVYDNSPQNSPQWYFGGLVGSIFSGTISTSYSTGNVDAYMNEGDYVGGFAGTIGGGNIYDSFATGTVYYNTAGTYYSSNYFGGFAGTQYGSVDNVYWYDQSYGYSCASSGDTTNCYSTGTLSDFYFESSSPMSGNWDFTTIWQEESGTFPSLKQFSAGPPCPNGMSGTGTGVDPCIVTDCTDLQSIGQGLTVYYQLNDNIDCSLHGSFTPIGNNTNKFTGYFDGNNKIITGVSVTSGSNYAGLFGFSQSNTINNVGLEDITVSGTNYAGGLIGEAYGVIVDNTYVNGSISGGSYVGGLVGRLSYYNGQGSIDNSYSAGNVDGSNSYVGGLVGGTFGSSSFISDSYSISNITCSYNLGQFVGGLIGYSVGYTSDSFAAGEINVDPGVTYVGGLAGYDSGTGFSNSYWYDRSEGLSCYDDGVGGGNSGCNTYTTESDFFDLINPPMNTWDYLFYWDNVCNESGYPSLLLEGFTDPENCTGYSGVPCPAGMLGSNTTGDPCQITNCTDLQAMDLGISGHYALYGDIYCADTVNWNSPYGFDPIGDYYNTLSDGFSGTFEGNNYTIFDLFINRTSEDYVGLFDYLQSANVSNVGLQNFSIAGGSSVGGLAGQTYGSNIDNVYVTGNISGTGTSIGGLIGWFDSFSGGIISNTYSSGNVSSSSSSVGGLIGYSSYGEIIDSYSFSDVYGAGSQGGLIGYSYYGNVTDSFAAGSVSGSSSIGGLIGYNSDTIITGGYWYNRSDGVDNCYDDIGGGGNTNCFTVDTGAHFFNIGNLPVNNWDFGFWDTFCSSTDGYPPLILQGISSLSDCPGYGSVFCVDGMTGGNTTSDPCLITSCTQLQNMSLDLSGHFALGGPIDCSGTSTWNYNGTDYNGFEPIGDVSNWFSGSFDGRNNTISNLYINRGTEQRVGLFSFIYDGTISNVGLNSFDITGNDRVGGLAGDVVYSYLYNISFSGSVTGTNDIGGGLVGYFNDYNIDHSYSTGTIAGSQYSFGGLVGRLYSGGIDNSYSTADVSCDTSCGGLVGDGGGSIDSSYSSSEVSGSYSVGGLIGDSYTDINSSYSISNVSGVDGVGGLVGYAHYGGDVDNSYAAGNVSGSSLFGGLIGYNPFGASIGNSYWYDRNQGLSCVGSGSGTCDGKTSLSYFHDIANEPMASWSYPPWDNFCDDVGHTSLEWENLVVESNCLNYNPISFPSVTEFGVEFGSTNFSEVVDPNTVLNLTLATFFGKIKFPDDYSVDANGEDYDTHIQIGPGFVSVDTPSLDPSFNAPANITITGVICPVDVHYGSSTYIVAQDILDEGNICDENSDPNCTIISCDGNLTFTVSHFTGFASAGSTNLTIWDETETDGSPYSGQTKYANDQVAFFANYTSSSGPMSDATCIINFTGDTNNVMSWNSSGFYEYNRSFSSDGVLDWNVTCNRTGYTTLTATDNVTITPPLCPAGMSGWNNVSSPCLITNCTQLQNMSLNLSGHYALNNSINCSDTINWGSTGFNPVGDSTTKFTGSFDGRNYTITDLYINRVTSNIGLFGYTIAANISNVGLENINISGTSNVGTIIGTMSNGEIDRCYSTGDIYPSQWYSGGLVGLILGSSSLINNSYSSVNISSSSYGCGGLVGASLGYVYNSYAVGNVISSSNDEVGGLMGYNTGTIKNCHSTGNVSGVGPDIGGLIGKQDALSGPGITNNSYYYNNTEDPYPCIGTDSGALADCVAQTEESYFFDVANEPMVNWSYPPWDSFCDGYGYITLDWQNVTNISNCIGYDANNISVIQELFINSTGNYTEEDLLCWANATDSNGDNLAYEGYWYKNGVQNFSFTTSPTKYAQGVLVNVATLDSQYTSIGENWSCQVRADDAKEYSEYNFTSNVTIVPSILTIIKNSTASQIYDYTGGTSTNVTVDSINGPLQLFGTNKSGEYISQGFNFSGSGAWVNISWNKLTYSLEGDWDSISAGNYHTCGILTNGTGYCWGENDFGQLGDGTEDVDRNESTPINISETFSVISSGQDYTCSVLTNGTAYCWGDGTQGRTGQGFNSKILNPSPVVLDENFSTVSSGFWHTCGILTNGSVYCWGSNQYGQLGNGTIGGIAGFSNVPIPINSSNTFIDVGVGRYHSCGILTNGSVYCWGRGDQGVLGNGGTSDKANPYPINSSETFSQISIGYEHSCGILTNGTAYCWGDNDNGQLGNGSLGGNIYSPVAINFAEAFENFPTAENNNFHSCGILTNGSVYCWGYNLFGQLGNGSTGSPVPLPGPIDSDEVFVSVSTGYTHTCGIIEDGSAYCWGQNNHGGLGNGETSVDGVPTPTPLKGEKVNIYTRLSENGTDWEGWSSVHTNPDILIASGDQNYIQYKVELSTTTELNPKLYNVTIEYGASSCVAGMAGANITSNPCLITDCIKLQNMSLDLSGHYALANDINCSDTINWDSNKGFNPIGCGGSNCGSRTISTVFSGSFDGRNNTISNLYINRNGENTIGLFGYLGGSNISNVGLENANITGSASVGALIGWATGSGLVLSNSYVTGNVIGSTSVGGLIGYFEYNMDISDVYSLVNVTGSTAVGGLMGYSDGSSNLNNLSNSYSSGNVSGSTFVGGLMGYAVSTNIDNSYSSGNVSGGSSVGGLVGGFAFSTLNNSYWYNRSQGLDCYSGGNTNCTAINNETYFFNVINEPMINWSYPPWDSFCDGRGYTPLEFQNINNLNECTGYFNVLPVIRQLVINSSLGTNYTNEDLSCWVNATDFEGVDLTYEGYWYKNGAQNISFNTTPTSYTEGVLVNVANLSSGNLTAGENWSCQIRAYDTEDYSTYNFTENITILEIPDNFYPIFSNYWDNNGTVFGSGTGYFNVTLENTNGTVLLEINGTNITATNLTSNVYNASYDFIVPGFYDYRWHSWGNGTFERYNVSEDRSYTVLGNSPVIKEIFVNSTGNYTTDANLTCWVNATDEDGGNVSYNGSWYDGEGVRPLFEQWNVVYDSGVNEYARDIAVDNSGNFYVTGNYLNAGDFLYTVGYDSDGNKIWNVTTYTIGSAEPTSIATDDFGNVYVVLQTQKLIIKYNSSEKQVFNVTWSGSGTQKPTSVVVDDFGNFYVTGTSYIAGTGEDYYTVKYNSTGAVNWSQRFSKINNVFPGDTDTAKDIAIDSSGNVYVTGYSRFATSNWYYNTVKYYNNGTQAWNKTYTPSFAVSSISVQGIAVDDSEEAVYITGEIDDANYFLIKYNATNGSEIWNASYDSGGNDYPWGIDIDSLGNIYVIGTYYSYPYYSYNLVKFNSTGDYVSNIIYDGGLSDFSRGVAVDNSDNIYVTGYSNNSVDYDFHTIKYSETFILKNQSEGVLINVSTLDSYYTSKGDWTCELQAYDGTYYSTSNTSNIFSILNTAPTHSTPILNSTSGNNLTTDNLTVYNQSTYDADGDRVKNIIDWRRDGNSVALLNMPFEGESNSTYTKDYSSFGNDGVRYTTFQNPLLNWNSTGGYDGFGAYEFNTSVCIKTDKSSYASVADAVSLSMWMKHNSSSTSRYFIGNADFYLRSNSTDPGTIGLITYDGQEYIIAWASGTYNDDNWHHIVAIYNGSDNLIYIDNVLRGNQTAVTPEGNALSRNYDFYIGGGGGCTNKPNATIDDVIVFNSSLSEEEILLLYNSRNDLILNSTTNVSDNWQACVTPTDGEADGSELCSDILRIDGGTSSNVTLLSPVYGFMNSNETDYSHNVNFSCNATTDDTLDRITLYIWNATNDLVTTIVNDSVSGTSDTSTFSYSFPYEGIYFWNCEAKTSVGDEDSADNNSLLYVVNGTYPKVSTNKKVPLNNSVYFNETVVFAFEVSSVNEGDLDCYLLVNDSIEESFTFSPGYNNVNTTLDEGTYNYMIGCYDNVSNFMTSQEKFFEVNYTVDTLAPNITLISPSNGKEFLFGNITLEYNASDNSGFQYCTLYTDAFGSWGPYSEHQNVIVANNVSEFSFLENLDFGTYKWAVNCSDQSGNSNISENYTFVVTDAIVCFCDSEADCAASLRRIDCTHILLTQDISATQSPIDLPGLPCNGPRYRVFDGQNHIISGDGSSNFANLESNPTQFFTMKNYVFALDNSGSMATVIEDLKNATKDLIDLIFESEDANDPRVGVVAFRDQAYTLSGLNDNPTVVKNSLEGMIAEGQTALGEGIDRACSVANASGSSLVILLSDGVQTAGNIGEYSGAARCADAGIQINVIAYGFYNPIVLQTIALMTGGSFYVASGGDINQSFIDMAYDQSGYCQLENITIKDTTITNFNTGVYSADAYNISLINLTINDTNTAIDFNNGSIIEISGVNASNSLRGLVFNDTEVGFNYVSSGIDMVGNVELISSSLVGHTQNITVAINLDGNLSIDSNSSINFTGKGYEGALTTFVASQGKNGTGPGGGLTYPETGASHGGFGEKDHIGITFTSSDIYDSSLKPRLPGSGGFSQSSTASYYAYGKGGDGGGAIEIHANKFDNNGSINVDANNATGGYYGPSDNVDENGGASGGSIYITANEFYGNGSYSARGSIGGLGYYSGLIRGGGGGRIAVYYNQTDLSQQDFVDKFSVEAPDTSGNDQYPPTNGTLIIVDEDDNSAFINYVFRFQDTLGKANESENTTFFNLNNIYVWNFSNLTILQSELFSELDNLTIRVTDTLSLNYSTLPNESLELEYGNLVGINASVASGSKLSMNKTSIGEISWTGTLEEEVEDIVTNVIIGQGYVRVNSTADSSLNDGANITLREIDASEPRLYMDIDDDGYYQDCPIHVCRPLTYGTTTIFNVTGFTGYSASENTSLTIVDDEHAYPNKNVTFNAYYVNESSGNFISGAVCNITFNDGSFSMVELGDRYEYNRSFSNPSGFSELVYGHQYNVTCNKSNFPALITYDQIIIYDDFNFTIIKNSTYSQYYGAKNGTFENISLGEENNSLALFEFGQTGQYLSPVFNFSGNNLWRNISYEANTTSFGWMQVSPGWDHTCGLMSNGTAYCWGRNDYGQVGNGSFGLSTSYNNDAYFNPVPVKMDYQFKEITSGDYFTCGILLNGTPYCWGRNDYGQLGNLTWDINSSLPLNPRMNFTNTNETVVPTFRKIDAGQTHVCGILTNGSAACWGYNYYGQLGNGDDSNSLDGTSSIVLVNSSEKFRDISAGGSHSCGVTIDGTAYCWGRNYNAQLGIGLGPGSEYQSVYNNPHRYSPIEVSGNYNFTSISAGDIHTCGILTNGSAMCWGMLEGLGYYTEDYFSYGGIFPLSGNYSNVPRFVNTSTTFKIISAEDHDTCGISTGGILYCWGRNSDGQFGIGIGEHLLPVSIGASQVVDVSLGDEHGCKINRNNYLAYCSGENIFGKLGNGDTSDKTSFTQVSNSGSGVQSLGDLNITSRFSADGSTWGSWSSPHTNPDDISYSLAGNKYVQYKVDFSRDLVYGPELYNVTMEYSLPRCGDYLYFNTTLTENLTCDGGNGFIINNSDVTLDCDGHSLTGTNPYTSTGILSSFDNITITNCIIHNWSKGISLSGSGGLIYNNHLNNTINAYDSGNNNWNIAKSLGPNIIGKTFKGGNYWHDYLGNDTSGDSLGDTLLPYDSNGNISTGGDYLPLVSTYCGDGVCNVDENTITCPADCEAVDDTDTDGGGGCSDQCTDGDSEKECLDSSTTRTRDCGNYDSDSCTEWSSWNEADCEVGEACILGTCYSQCTDTCESLGYTCGSHSICGLTLDCGTCTSDETCTEEGVCECKEDWECSWSECSGDAFSSPYDCEDRNECGTEFDKPTDKACEVVEQERSEGRDDDCISDWSCEQWGECESDYTLEDVLNDNVNPQGFQRRICTDLAGCNADKTDKRLCTVSVPVEADLVEWCEETYVEVYDKNTNKLVSRVKSKKEVLATKEIERIDISLITTEFTGYCDYCYDGVKNYDEEDVDCGGPSCPECVEEEGFFDWYPWLLVFLFASVAMLTATRVWVDRNVIMFFLSESSRQDLPSYVGPRAPKRKIPKAEKTRGISLILSDLFGKRFGLDETSTRVVERKDLAKVRSRRGLSPKEIQSYQEKKIPKTERTFFTKIKELFIKSDNLNKIREDKR